MGCTVAAADEINDNGRVYPEAIQDREMERINKIIDERWAYGAADHPEDGVSRITNVAALFTKRIEKQIIKGRKLYKTEALILNTEPGGKNLQEMIRAKGKVHLSQRGWGDLKREDWNGKEADVVQDNYKAKTFDFVIGGSTKGAEVGEQITEQMGIINLIEAGPCEGCQANQGTKSEKGGSRIMEIKSIEELKKAYPDLCLQIETEAMTRKEKEVKEAMETEFKKTSKEIGEGIRKQIEESEEYKSFKKGMDVHKAIILEVLSVLKPYFSEMGEDEEEAEAQFEDVKKQLEQSKKDNEDLKKKIAKDQQDAEEQKKAKKKVSEMTAGKEHGDLISERLQDCRTEEEVVARFKKEEEFVKRVLAEKTGKPEKGVGHAINENKEDEKNQKVKEGELTEEQKRQRTLAGLPPIPTA